MNKKGYSSKAEVQKIRDEEIRLALKYFHGKCRCCTRSVHKKKRSGWVMSFVGFTYHHLEYRDGEPRRKNYPKGATGTWAYKKDVLPFVEKYHKEFFLMCNVHHSIVEKLKRIYDHHPDWLEAIIEVVKLTKT